MIGSDAITTYFLDYNILVLLITSPSRFNFNLQVDLKPIWFYRMLMLRAPSFIMQLCVSKSIRKLCYLIAYMLAGLLIISSFLGKMWIYWGKSSWCFIGWDKSSKCKSTRSVLYYMLFSNSDVWNLYSITSSYFLVISAILHLTKQQPNNNHTTTKTYLTMTWINLLEYIKIAIFLVKLSLNLWLAQIKMRPKLRWESLPTVQVVV